MGRRLIPRRVAALCVTAWCLLLAAWPLLPAAARAQSSVFRGRTSQHREIKVTIDEQQKLISLVAHVATRCTGGSKRSFDLDFEPMNIEPQSATGAVRGSINEFAGSFFGGGASYREHASFVAQLAGAKVAGRIEAKRKYDSGPTCKTGWVTFRVRL